MSTQDASDAKGPGKDTGGYTKVQPPRALTRWETAVLERLVPEDMQETISSLQVFAQCSCGCASVSFVPEPRGQPLFSEAHGFDADGMLMWLLLFANAGEQELDGLEVQRADGDPIMRLPDAGSIILGPPAEGTGARE